MMNTIVNPLPDDEYDIDDGVYINGYRINQKRVANYSTVHIG